jgi:hypothetical protein
MENIKVEQKEEIFPVYISSCPYCGKRIKQLSEDQTRYNMMVHLVSCLKRKEKEKNVKS